MYTLTTRIEFEHVSLIAKAQKPKDAATADGHDDGTSANGHAHGRKCNEEGAMRVMFCVCNTTLKGKICEVVRKLLGSR